MVFSVRAASCNPASPRSTLRDGSPRPSATRAKAHILSSQATTETGLNSVLLNNMTFWQQVLLFASSSLVSFSGLLRNAERVLQFPATHVAWLDTHHLGHHNFGPTTFLQAQA